MRDVSSSDHSFTSVNILRHHFFADWHFTWILVSELIPTNCITQLLRFALTSLYVMFWASLRRVEVHCPSDAVDEGSARYEVQLDKNLKCLVPWMDHLLYGVPLLGLGFFLKWPLMCKFGIVKRGIFYCFIHVFVHYPSFPIILLFFFTLKYDFFSDSGVFCIGT